MNAFPFYSKFSFMSSGIIRRLVNNRSKILTITSNKPFTVFKTSVLEKQEICPYICFSRCMAGHAKWQNIKHVKAEKDKQKTTLYNKYVRLVVAAVREKGVDPKSNIKLANILEEAKRNNVPSATLDKAMHRATSKKTESGIIEMLGPGGCTVVLDYETDNVSEMRRALKVICKKYSAGIYPGGRGRWRAAYEQKGIIRVTGQLNGNSVDGEKMLDAAIEAGAEDVQKLDEDNNILYEFLCSPDDVMIVKKELEKTFVIEEAYIGYIPVSLVALVEADKNIAMSFLNEVGDLADVSRLYENIE